VEHTGKRPDYLGEPGLPAVVKLGTLETSLPAAVNQAGAARLNTKSSTLVEILQAANILMSLHVRYCNWR